MKEKLTKSLETYLLAIDTLIKSKKTVIVKDVAQFLKYGGATTSNAIKKLKEKGYINYEPYGNISLTSLGESAVLVKKYRHETISNFLNQVLEIDKNEAEINADAIEYSMTDEVLTKLVYFMDFMKRCTCPEPKWINNCKKTLENGKMSDKCTKCSGCCCQK